MVMLAVLGIILSASAEVRFSASRVGSSSEDACASRPLEHPYDFAPPAVAGFVGFCFCGDSVDCDFHFGDWMAGGLNPGGLD
jgi:hypothetical protein